MSDYPLAVRIDRSPRSSRLWAVLSLLFIKPIALIPHFIVLAILGVAVFVAFVIAEVAVLFTGVYPQGLHSFVTGVIRWQLRVGAFFLSLTDRYPPFGFQTDDNYPVDVKVAYPARSSRLLAGLTVALLAVGVAVLIAAGRVDNMAPNHPGSIWSFNGWAGWANLRAILQIPHYILLAFYGIAVVVVWYVWQFVILVTGRMGEGMYGWIGRFVRWATRVSAFTYGLTDKYPPFSGGAGPQDEPAAGGSEEARAAEAA